MFNKMKRSAIVHGVGLSATFMFNLPSLNIYFHTRKSIHLNTQNRNSLKCVLSHFPNGWLGCIFTPFSSILAAGKECKITIFVISKTPIISLLEKRLKTKQDSN